MFLYRSTLYPPNRQNGGTEIIAGHHCTRMLSLLLMDVLEMSNFMHQPCKYQPRWWSSIPTNQISPLMSFDPTLKPFLNSCTQIPFLFLPTPKICCKTSQSQIIGKQKLISLFQNTLHCNNIFGRFQILDINKCYSILTFFKVLKIY